MKPVQPLTLYNTLGVECLAKDVHVITEVPDLQKMCGADDFLVLGGGSNVVLAPRIERPLAVIALKGLAVKNVGEAVEITAGAGENWHNLVRWSLGLGLSGLENLVLIPGSVGAAPVQNIGAYGAEIAEVFTRLVAVERRTGKSVVFDSSDCQFSYRDSMFKSRRGEYVITEVTLTLSPDPKIDIGYSELAEEVAKLGLARVSPVHVAEAVTRIRRRKLPDPRWVPNAGSFFKNPVVGKAAAERLPDLLKFPSGGDYKLSAAQLIERCGFKAQRSGAVRVWSRQPLVIVNPGHASGVQVLEFAEEIRQSVEQKFAIRLEIEPDLLGFP